MITLFMNQPTREIIKNGKRCFGCGYFKIQKKSQKLTTEIWIYTHNTKHALTTKHVHVH